MLTATGATNSTEASSAYENRATFRTRCLGTVTVGIMLVRAVGRIIVASFPIVVLDSDGANDS
jgi:hypothetical protein